MTHLTHLKRIGTIGGSVLLTALALAACGGGSSDEPMTAAAASGSIPASAGASVQGFVEFQTSLAATDSAEALKLQSFLPPNDDSAEPFAIR